MMKPTLPLLWRIEAVSPEKAKIVLGKFHTDEEAKAEMDRHEREGRYKNIRIVAVPPPPPGQEPTTGYRRPGRPPGRPAGT